MHVHAPTRGFPRWTGIWVGMHAGTRRLTFHYKMEALSKEGKNLGDGLGGGGGGGGKNF